MRDAEFGNRQSQEMGYGERYNTEAESDTMDENGIEAARMGRAKPEIIIISF